MEATYRIGPSDFFTPGDLKADADTLQSQVVALERQSNGRPGLPIDLVDAWVLFQGDWAAFYYQNFGGWLTNFLTAANNSNRDQLVQFEVRFADIAKRYANAGVEAAGVSVQPKAESGPTGVFQWATFAIVGLIVLVVIVGKAVD